MVSGVIICLTVFVLLSPTSIRAPVPGHRGAGQQFENKRHYHIIILYSTHVNRPLLRFGRLLYIIFIFIFILLLENQSMTDIAAHRLQQHTRVVVHISVFIIIISRI